MATTTSLQFKITSAYDGGAVDRARASIEALNRDLDTLSNKSVKVTVQVDNSALTRLRAELDQFARIHSTATASVNANTAPLDAARASLDRFGAMHVNAAAGVNTNLHSLDAARVSMDAFSHIHATATASVNVNVANLGAARAALAAWGATHSTATADVNVDRAHLHLGFLTRDSGVAGNALGDMTRLAGAAAPVVAGVGSAAGGAAAGLGGVTQAAGGAAGGLGGVASEGGGAASSLGGVASAIGIVSLAMAAFVALAPLMAASIVLIPLAFIGVATTLIGHVKSLKKEFKEAFQDVLQKAIPLVMPLMKALIGALQQVGQWLTLIGPAIHAAFAAAAPLVRPLLDILLHLVGAALPGFTTAMKNMKPLLDGMGQGATALGSALGTAAAMFSKIPGLGQIMNQVMSALGQVFVAFAKVIVQIVSADHGQLLIQTLKLITITLQVLTPLIQLNGFIWLGFIVILRGVMVVILAIENGFKAFGQLLQGQGPILNALKVAWSATWNAMKVAAEAVWNGLKVAWAATISGLTTAWNAVSAALRTAWDAVWNAMKVAATAVWNAMVTAWRAVTSGFATAWAAVSGALSTAWNATWNGLKTAAQAVWNALQVAWSAFVNALRTVWSAVSGALVTAWNAVWNGLKTAAQAVWSAMQTAWNAFVNALRTVWTTVSSALVTAWNAVWNALRTAAQAVWTAMQTAWNTFTNALRTAWTTVASALTTAWNATWNALKTAAIAVWNALQTAWTAFTMFLRNLWNSFSSAMTSAWNTFWNAIKTAAIAVWNALQTAWQAFTNFMHGLLTGFVNVFKTIWNDFWNGIKTVALDIWHALQTAWDTFSSGFQAAVRLLVLGVKHDWDALQDIFKAPIHFVIATVINGGIIKAINWVIGKLGGSSTAVPDVPVPFATGGHVRGPGTGTSDSIPARLSDGEYVLRADAVRRIGVDKLDQMNGTGQIAGMSPQVAALQAQGFPIGAMMAKNKGGFADGGLTAADIQSMFGDIIKSIGGAGAGLLAKATGAVGGVAGTVKKVVSHIPLVGGLLAKGAGAVQSVADSITSALQSWGAKEFATASADLIQKILTKLPIPGGNGPLGEMAHGFTNKVVGAFGGHITKLIADFLFKQQQVSVTSMAVGAIPAGQHKAVIDAALAAAGVPPPGSLAQWEAGLNTLITRESAWNPNAINRTDSNAVAGIPSQGLAQVIPPTFAANHVPGTSMNILDPVANIAAAIRYIVRTYGNISNVQQANASLPPKGYWTGTSNARRGWHLVGERGAEWAHFNGGEKVLPHGQSPDDDGSPVVVHVENHWHGPVTKEAIQHAEGPMADKLRMAVQAGCGKRRH